MIFLLCAFSWAQPVAFPTRVDVAISKTQQEMKIELQDMLGEGEGAWDNDPRYPTDSLNCMTWLQWVLAQAYMPDEPITALDALRYYNSEPSFATRKHYIDRWLALDPGPMKSISAQLSGAQTKEITLELDKLTQSRGYSCELAAPLVNTMTIHYLSSADFLAAIPELPAGWYAVFPIANELYYTELYKSSGPMGQVHSMLLDTRAPELKIWHASLDYAAVVSEAPEKFAHRMRNLIDGFAIYELDPNWMPNKKSEALWPSSEASLRCEEALNKP